MTEKEFQKFKSIIIDIVTNADDSYYADEFFHYIMNEFAIPKRNNIPITLSDCIQLDILIDSKIKSMSQQVCDRDISQDYYNSFIDYFYELDKKFLEPIKKCL